MPVSLYRKFRPATFKEVIGQEHIVRTLTNQVKTGSISHAYIFTGTRGTGKTSVAKILARAVNCLSPIDGSPCGVCSVCKISDGIDVFELDGASNNGVDEIRALRDGSNFPPIGGKYKVYIIDEVHMLTINAFNALLKTLEEPPEHIIFILATTEIHKVPQTVLSRCMRFDFRLVPADIIAGRLASILGGLKVVYEEQALSALAKLGEGSVRDALSYADVVLAYSPKEIRYRDVLDVLGVNPPDAYIPFAEAVLDGDTKRALLSADKLFKTNGSVQIFRREVSELFRNLIFLKSADGVSLGLSKESAAELKRTAEKYDAKTLFRAFDIFVRLESDIRYSSNPRILFEAAVIRAADFSGEIDETGLLIRLKNLENRISVLTSSKVGLPEGQAPPAELKEPSAIPPKEEALPDTGGPEQDEWHTQAPPSALSYPPAPAVQVKRSPAALKNARALLGKVILTFRKKGHLQLSAACENVVDVELIGSELLIYFTDEADYNSFCLKENKAAAQGILDEFADGIILKPVLRKDSDTKADEEAERLKLLFSGDNVVIPKK